MSVHVRVRLCPRLARALGPACVPPLFCCLLPTLSLLGPRCGCGDRLYLWAAWLAGGPVVECAYRDVAVQQLTLLVCRRRSRQHEGVVLLVPVFKNHNWWWARGVDGVLRRSGGGGGSGSRGVARGRRRRRRSHRAVAGAGVAYMLIVAILVTVRRCAAAAATPGTCICTYLWKGVYTCATSWYHCARSQSPKPVTTRT